ncbi:hypothetical protein L7F22_011606 [Adiantum nelumboides]|nr:hypothetical protein [Adiantum nelumboides]
MRVKRPSSWTPSMGRSLYLWLGLVESSKQPFHSAGARRKAEDSCSKPQHGQPAPPLAAADAASLEAMTEARLIRNPILGRSLILAVRPQHLQHIAYLHPCAG